MKYIKEYSEYNNNISIKIIDYDYNEPINESLNGRNYSYKTYEYDEYNYKGKQQYVLNNNEISILNDYEDKTRDYLRKLNKFKGEYKNRNNQNVIINYELSYSQHYIEKYLRKDVEDPDGTIGFLNPKLHEGIDFIYNNINYITNYIQHGLYKDNYRVLIIISNSYGYEVIIGINIKNKNEVNLSLITQMKGTKSYNKKKSNVVSYFNGDGSETQKMINSREKWENKKKKKKTHP